MAHHTKSYPLLSRSKFAQIGVLVAVCVALATPGVAAEPAKRKQADPFAGDTWHAINQTWPGTLKFDAKAKTVKLEPIGAPPMEASYAYTADAAAEKNVASGALTMTQSTGAKSVSKFRIEGKKKLYLTFMEGQRPEEYVRMTPKEEAAERIRIEELILSGKLMPNKLEAGEAGKYRAK